MRAAKAVLLEALLVTLAGLLLALAANALSPQGLKLSRDYFPAPPPSPIASATNAVTSVATPIHPATPANPTNTAPQATAAAGAVPEAVLRRLQQQGLQVLMGNDVTRLFRDPRYEQGLIVFIDARDDAHYAAGHIPGAHQFNHYRPEQYLPTVLPACLGALQVVVYCTGGQCEDSEFAAIMLRDAGIQRENLFVFPGGIHEWTALKLPLELGTRKSGQMKP